MTDFVTDADLDPAIPSDHCQGCTKELACDGWCFECCEQRRSKGPLEPEACWYTELGSVIVSGDDRFHGYASKFREMVESLSAWGDPALWQYNLDLLREALEHEQATLDREWRSVQRDADNEGLADDFNAGAFEGGCNPEPSQGGHGNG